MADTQLMRTVPIWISISCKSSLLPRDFHKIRKQSNTRQSERTRAYLLTYFFRTVNFNIVQKTQLLGG
jgi:hypothetical protein